MISVVIPVYNVEQYIAKCLNSVLNQTYGDLEVIVVNDGSTDGGDEIIKRFLGDARVKYIEQKNAGVTAARNAGIEAATGEYLAFVDSDDFLALSMYEKLYAAIESADADVAVCDYNLVYDDHIQKEYSSTKDEVISISDYTNYFFRYCACPKPNNYIWTKLYRMDVVKKSGVRFLPFKLGDDTMFNFMLLPYISSVVSIAGGFYYYLQRSDSNIYTVARRSNLAQVYASSFEFLADYFRSIRFESGFMPLHAYTRLRSVFYYSRLAKMSEKEIVESVIQGFTGASIMEYMADQSLAERFCDVNGFEAECARRIKRIMKAMVENPMELVGAEFV